MQTLNSYTNNWERLTSFLQRDIKEKKKPRGVGQLAVVDSVATMTMMKWTLKSAYLDEFKKTRPNQPQHTIKRRRT